MRITAVEPNRFEEGLAGAGSPAQRSAGARARVAAGGWAQQAPAPAAPARTRLPIQAPQRPATTPCRRGHIPRWSGGAVPPSAIATGYGLDRQWVTQPLPSPPVRPPGVRSLPAASLLPSFGWAAGSWIPLLGSCAWLECPSRGTAAVPVAARLLRLARNSVSGSSSSFASLHPRSTPPCRSRWALANVEAPGRGSVEGGQRG